jgi:DnaK suppressor protein
VYADMTNEQRKHLEARLLEERQRVAELLERYYGDTASESLQDRAGDLSLAPYHRADEGTATMDSEFDAANAARETEELAEIDAALERLYAHPDQFGRDEGTGEEIPFARLDVIPWARSATHAGD